MLTRAQEKLIRSLSTKKGRAKHGLCLVEGQKLIDVAGSAVEYTFTPWDTGEFRMLVTTESPQTIAGVAKVPTWTMEQVTAAQTILVLDGVQDPGNVGAILRLCQGFGASLILIDSVDVTNPKVVRSSVGALFHVPWVTISRDEAVAAIQDLGRPVYRLERGGEVVAATNSDPSVIVVGSEGNGILLPIEGTSISIAHNDALESLNVGHAVAITLYARSQI